MLKSWTVSGTDETEYRTSVYEPATVKSLRVSGGSAGWPAALVVDRVVVDGVTFQSEDSSVRSNGSWSQDTGCAPGNKQSKWISCPDGWLEYPAAEGTQLAAATPSSSAGASRVELQGLDSAGRVIHTIKGSEGRVLELEDFEGVDYSALEKIRVVSNGTIIDEVDLSGRTNNGNATTVGLALFADSRTTATSRAPRAVDAVFKPVPPKSAVEGNRFVRHVEHKGTTHPVAADPEISIYCWTKRGCRAEFSAYASRQIAMMDGSEARDYVCADKSRNARWFCQWYTLSTYTQESHFAEMAQQARLALAEGKCLYVDAASDPQVQTGAIKRRCPGFTNEGLKALNLEDQQVEDLQEAIPEGSPLADEFAASTVVAGLGSGLASTAPSLGLRGVLLAAGASTG